MSGGRTVWSSLDCKWCDGDVGISARGRGGPTVEMSSENDNSTICEEILSTFEPKSICIQAFFITLHSSTFFQRPYKPDLSMSDPGRTFQPLSYTIYA